jgi:nitrilase
MAGKHKPVLGGRDSVKVAIAQVAQSYLDREKSIDKACQVIKEAAAQGAELIVFPEAWLAGYPYWTEGWDSAIGPWIEGRVRFRDAAVLAPSEDTEKLGRAAKAANAHVVIGCNEIDPRPEVGTIYNTLLYFGRDGTLLGRHRKLMPTFSERTFWGAGDASDLIVLDTDIGRIGGLICGEHLMTLVRAAMIAQGEDFHVAVFPGSFALHTGPQMVEPDAKGDFWGHALVRAHAFESGAFVVSACGYIDEAAIAEGFPHKGKMNIGWGQGGSSVIAPLGIALAGPVFGSQIVYAECQAWMIKAVKAIVDTMGHYARPDVLRLMVRGESGWRRAGPMAVAMAEALPRDRLKRAAEEREVDLDRVEEAAERMIRQVG